MLDKLAIQYGTDKSSKCHDYCRHYEYLWGNAASQYIRLLEIGIWTGASLKMWAQFFPYSLIVGVDNNEDCVNNIPKSLERVRGLLGDYTDPNFIHFSLEIPYGLFDIIIDDADHNPAHQMVAFRHLWPLVAQGGYYAIEDLQAGFHSMFSPDGMSLYPWVFDQVRLLDVYKFDSVYFAKDLVIFKKGVT